MKALVGVVRSILCLSQEGNRVIEMSGITTEHYSIQRTDFVKVNPIGSNENITALIGISDPVLPGDYVVIVSPENSNHSIVIAKISSSVARKIFGLSPISESIEANRPIGEGYLLKYGTSSLSVSTSGIKAKVVGNDGESIFHIGSGREIPGFYTSNQSIHLSVANNYFGIDKSSIKLNSEKSCVITSDNISISSKSSISLSSKVSNFEFNQLISRFLDFVLETTYYNLVVRNLVQEKIREKFSISGHLDLDLLSLPGVNYIEEDTKINLIAKVYPYDLYSEEGEDNSGVLVDQSKYPSYVIKVKSKENDDQSDPKGCVEIARVERKESDGSLKVTDSFNVIVDNDFFNDLKEKVISVIVSDLIEGFVTNVFEQFLNSLSSDPYAAGAVSVGMSGLTQFKTTLSTKKNSINNDFFGKENKYKSDVLKTSVIEKSQEG